jgi:two-component sensor histidine kinase
VEVRWHLQEGRLRLSWQESGGPPARPPARRGFGSRVIEQTVQRQLGGRLERHWTATGLNCEIDIPHGPAALQPQAQVAAA